MQRVVVFDHLRYYSLISRANSFKKKKKRKRNIIGVHLLFNRQWYFHSKQSRILHSTSHIEGKRCLLYLLWNLWHCKVLGKYRLCDSRANSGECNSVRWLRLKIRRKWRIRGLWCRIVFEKIKFGNISMIRDVAIFFSKILFNKNSLYIII